MSRVLTEEVVMLIKDLIKQLCHYEEGSEAFNYIEKHVTTQLKKADSMFFFNKKEIDRAISGMSQKFMFHGFFTQAACFEKAYNKYIHKDIPKGDLTNKLNVIKFLLDMSESPTNNFWNNPEEFECKEEEAEEIINWGEFLNEGIKIWVPPDGDSSSQWSSESEVSFEDIVCKDETDSRESKPPIITDNHNQDVIIDFRANREELLNTIQHTWYNIEKFTMYPESTWEDANVGIRWEEYLKDQVKGLIPLETSSIITEYKVMREVVWQLFQPHTSTVFELKEDKIQPKSNITISSVRQVCFKSFMAEFVPYIELMDYFREFELSLFEDSERVKAETYNSYFKCVKSMVSPVYFKIVDIENRIREQETTMTLLKLADELKEVFEPLHMLRQIHDFVTESYASDCRLHSATDLLHKLHESLQTSYCKLEHDIKVSLYLDSLYYYFKIIDSWLMKDDFADYTNEFVIEMIKETESEEWKMNFALKCNIRRDRKRDGIIKIICEDVLEIGRNLKLLRQLGKYHLATENPGLDFTKMKPLHEDFVNRVLAKLCRYYDYEATDLLLQNKQDEDQALTQEIHFKYPVICTDACKKLTEMDKLENVVDTTDGFLMKAFESYFIQAPEEKQSESQDLSLFERISKITKTIFPTEYFFERIFTDILKERFTISGLMVKNLLIEEYKLDKQFEFLRHIFLFYDDLVFPFYRRLFAKLNSSNKKWGNNIWLTSHIQDIIMDLYPDFYEKCNLEVKEYWRDCYDVVCSLDLVNVIYKIDWPLNIIITKRHMRLYQELFSVLLKLKWNLYTLNHLAFKDIEPKRKKQRPNKAYNITVMRLKYLRFSLLNIVNSIQHYIFGLVYHVCLNKFELDFEKSNDLKTLTAAHSNFIETLHQKVFSILGSSQNQKGFDSISQSVKILHNMWNNTSLATNEKLNDCYAMYKSGLKVLDPIINPTYIYDY